MNVQISIIILLFILLRSPLSGQDSTQIRGSDKTSYYPQDPARRPQTRRQKVQSCLSHNALTILTVSGVVGGIVLGVILRNVREEPWTKREIMYVNYIGELFLRMLKSLILPLIVASLISAIGSLDLSLSGRIGARAITYYMLTTVSAVILGKISILFPPLFLPLLPYIFHSSTRYHSGGHHSSRQR